MISRVSRDTQILLAAHRPPWGGGHSRMNSLSAEWGWTGWGGAASEMKGVHFWAMVSGMTAFFMVLG